MLYGVDVHGEYQRGLRIEDLPGQGYTYGVVKATEGVGFTAPRYDEFINRFRAAGMVTGAYHWLRAGDGAAQARYFLDKLQAVGGHHGLLIQLDVEHDGYGREMQAWAAEWNHLTGHHPFLIYSGAWWWPRTGGFAGASLTPHLWHSRYLEADPDTITDDPAAFADRIPASWWAPGYGGWPEATFLQFTSRGDAGSLGNNVDLNVFRGSLDDLLVLAGGGAVADDWGRYGPPPDDDRTTAVRVADLHGEEHEEHSPYVKTDVSARTRRLMRIEDKLDLILKALASVGGPLEGAAIVEKMEHLAEEERARDAELRADLAAGAQDQADRLET